MLHFFWLIFFLALPFSKWLSTASELALVAFTLYKFNWSSFKQNLYAYRHVAFLMLFFGCLLLGLLYTDNLSNGLRVIRHQHRFLVIPLLFLANAHLVRKNIAIYASVFVMAATASGLVVAVLYWLPEHVTRNLANNLGIMRDYPDMHLRAAFGLYSPFIERIQLSSLIAIAILTAIYLVSVNYKKWLHLVLLAFMFYVMLILGGRGGQVSLMGALLLYASFISVRFIFPVLQKKLGTAGATTVIILAFAAVFAGVPWAAYKTMPSVQDRINQTRWELELINNGRFVEHDYNNFTTLRRIVSWQNMWTLVKRNPVFGTGTGDYYQELENVYAEGPVQVMINSHSQYLMIWAMTGILGLVVFVGSLVYWLYSLRRPTLLFYYAAAFFIFYILNMSFDAVLFTQVDSMAFSAFFSLIGLLKPLNSAPKHA
ncbi:MAG: O-antigen ligase family protein [Hymenobacteraceae bacterium]|nr:O-antigen ligase family protein [Hymenobacteraceae bacterium]